ncbi:MAG: protein kinase [Candidatus Eremiobacterota bacterium]
MHEAGAVLHNKYTVKKLLGKGAMGSVYLVETLSDRKQLVVKELNFSAESRVNNDSAREIFFRESEFMARFNHAGLPEMHGIFSQDSHDYIVMDYVKGSTLEDIINKSTEPVPLEKAIKWAIEIADILNYLHNTFEMPLIYKDLKPSNIMITPQEKVMIIDFGICRYYNPDKDTDTFRLGSPGYAAPEQYKGRGQSCIQTDIYALGVILFQMVTKYDPTLTPFKFPPIKSLNPSIDDDLEAIINRAIQLQPLKRYIGALELKEKLEQYKKSHFPGKAGEIKKQVPRQVQPKTPAVKSQKKSSHKKHSPPRPAKKGFTLIEFMIVLSIISILAAIVIPNILNAKRAKQLKISGETRTETPDMRGETRTETPDMRGETRTETPDMRGENTTETPGISRETGTRRNECIRNLKDTATGLEMCFTDRGCYPPGISSIVRLGYVKELKCPFSNQAYIYIASSDRKAFTLCCPGNSVHGSEGGKFQGNYPQYSSSRGIIPAAWNIK